MGWESDVTAASSLLGTAAKFATANSTSSAVQTSAGYQETNIANQTLRKAGSLQASYLQSGIALDPDTAVNSAISQAFTQGSTDISRVQANANTQSANAFTLARSQALSGLGDSALKIFNPNGKGGSDGFDANGIGQTVGSWLDPSPVGPYQNPF